MLKQQTKISKEILEKKILFRANHRGCKETDFLLGRFFNHKLKNNNNYDLRLLDKFLNEDDILIYNWILGKESSPEIYYGLIDEIRNFHNTNF